MDGSRSISSTIASRRASRNASMRGSADIHVPRDGLGRRLGRALRELDGVLHLRDRLGVELLQALERGDPEPFDALAQERDRIAVPPLLHLFLGAILGGVGHGM